MSNQTMPSATTPKTAPEVSRRGRRVAADYEKRTGRGALKWFLRLLVAGPAAAVSLGHVHETAVHFGQSGAMGWAEAVGMEAVTALALMELDEGRHRRHGEGERAGLPWCLLVAAVLLSLGSNVFAVLQQGGSARSFGGVVYGGWPTLAFLAVAWLWHMEARRQASAPVVVAQLPADDEGQEPGEPPRNARAAIEDRALQELKVGRQPVAAAIAREVGVTPQYAGRIIRELSEATV